MIPQSQVVNPAGSLHQSWLQWFARADRTVEAARSYGPTANRPDATVAYIGMVYFDTDLGVDAIGMPIWAAQVSPSTVTWVDGAGNTV
jgi:hypothetical protein